MKALAAGLLASLAVLAAGAHPAAASGPPLPLAAEWTRALPLVESQAGEAGRLFTASENYGCGTVRAIDARTGVTAWWRTLASSGACATPSVAVAAGRVFAFDGATLRTFDTGDGTVLWRRQISRAPDYDAPPPVATPDVVYVHQVGPYPGYARHLLALDAQTGVELWRRTEGDSGHPLAVAGDDLYAGDGCAVAALDRATGDQRWKRTYECEGWEGPDTISVSGTHVVAWWDDFDRGGHVLRRSDGEPVRPFFSARAPAVAGSTLVVSRDGAVVGENLADGARRWRYSGEPPGVAPLEVELDGAPLVAGATAFVTDEAGHVHGIDAGTGRLRWRALLESFGRGQEEARPLTAVGDTLFVPTDRRLFGFRPGPAEAEIVSGPPAQSDSNRARFEFAVPAGRRTECELDWGSWVPCASPHDVRLLASGAHTLRIRHRADARIGAPSVAWRWRVTAPTPPADPAPGGPYPGYDDTVLVSRSTSGTVIGESQFEDGPATSCTGRYVAFSTRSPLIAGRPFARHPEIVVRDLATRTTRAGSVGTLGTRLDPRYLASDPKLSADGRVLVFAANDPAFSLEDDDGEGHWEAPGPSQIYARDMVTGVTVLVSRATGLAGAVADLGAEAPALSANGRYVAFTTKSRLDRADAEPGVNDTADTSVYVRDLLTQRTILVGDGFGPSISGSGNRIAYTRFRPAYESDDAAVMVRDRAAGTTLRIGAPPGARALGPALSANGLKVAYRVDREDEHGSASSRILVRDLLTGATTLVSRADGRLGRPNTGHAGHASLSADGRTIAFASDDPDLDPLHEEGERGPSAYVRDLRRGTTRLVNLGRGSHGRGGGAIFVNPAVSGDGTAAVFSTDSKLVSGRPDLEHGSRIYARGIADRTAATAALCDEPLPLP